MTALTTPEAEVFADLPDCDTTDPSDLAAHYGAFGFFDHIRKIVLANCTELERARAIQRNEKITETRLMDLARQSPNYVHFIAENLVGRRLHEKNLRDSLLTGR